MKNANKLNCRDKMFYMNIIAQKEAEKKAKEEEKAKAAAQKKMDRVKAKIETQVVSTAGQLLRKGLFGILSRK